MRIGMLTQWYDPEPGPASLPGALARGLTARGHEVHVVTGFPNYPSGEVADGYRIRPRATERRDGVIVHRVALYPSHGRSALGRVANYGSFAGSSAALGVPSAFSDLDAMWVNYSPITVGLPQVVQHLLRHTPTLVHVLDLWPDTLQATGFGGSGRVGRALTWAAGRACDVMYRRASQVAYISPGVGAVLEQRGVEQRKLAYAPMWADERVFRPRPRSGAQQFGVADDELALVYAGTIGHAQGLDVLLSAMKQVSGLPIRCLIAGSGVDEQRLRDRARDERIPNVTFLGRLPASQMGDLMAASDLSFVSLNDDPLSAITMPSKLQAVLASGRGVLGSLTGDAAAVVQAAEAGWVSEPGDVAGLAANLGHAVHSSRDELGDLGARGYSYYEREFSYDVGVNRIERLLVAAADEQR